MLYVMLRVCKDFEKQPLNEYLQDMTHILNLNKLLHLYIYIYIYIYLQGLIKELVVNQFGLIWHSYEVFAKESSKRNFIKKHIGIKPLVFKIKCVS
jgi:hypothetical protein